MKQKTDYVIQTFSLPNTERVIQDYRCSITTEEQGASGKIFITQNYVLFASSDNSVLESIPFFRISSVIHQKSIISLLGGIILDMDSGQVTLSGLMHREETFNLIRHLWTFQPTYVQLSEDDMLSQIKDA